jgi:hypothetical protein
VLAVAALAATAAPSAQAAGVSGQGTWETTLQGRDLDGDATTFEAYYDTSLDITWLADANYLQTSSGNPGYTSWYGAMHWVAHLNINGTTGWRLPSLVDTGASGCDWSSGGTDCGYNVDTSSSELAHLYHVTLGNQSDVDDANNNQLENTGPFSNVQSYSYWSNVEYALRSVEYAPPQSVWYFSTYGGYQYVTAKSSEGYAWAVRPGDVAAVPEPQAYALALAGLATLLAVCGRRHA